MIKNIKKYLRQFKTAPERQASQQGDTLPDDLYIMQSGVIPVFRDNKIVKTVLITSRNGKKWILPKGFIEEGMSPSESARKEAMEEAGICGHVYEYASGFYEYERGDRRYRVLLFPMIIDAIMSSWPESGIRSRAVIEHDTAGEYINDRAINLVIKDFFSGSYFKSISRKLDSMS